MAPTEVEAVAADLEGTLTTAETWRAVASYLKAGGDASRYRNFVLRRLPRVLAARAGIIDRQRFRDRWITDLAVLLKGLSADETSRLAERIVDGDLWPARRRDVIEELSTHRAAGRAIILCSGTYQPVLDAFARRLGAEALGTAMEVHAGSLTGRLAEQPNTGRRKARRLQASLDGRILYGAYGDSLADSEMLEASRVPVAVHPEPRLRRLAVERGWRVLE